MRIRKTSLFTIWLLHRENHPQSDVENDYYIVETVKYKSEQKTHCFNRMQKIIHAFKNDFVLYIYSRVSLGNKSYR